MPNDQERVIAFFGQLASAVVHAVKEGTDADRQKLVATLTEMSAGMPAISEDAANARDFLDALISLLKGEPESSEGLVEPFKGIYSRIVGAVLAPHAGHSHGDGHEHGNGHGARHSRPAQHDEDSDIAMKEFLTQIAASTVLVMRKGEAEDKKALAVKLEEVRQAMPEQEMGPRSLLEAFISILKGKPVSPDRLQRPYSSIYKKVLTDTGLGAE